MVVRSVHAVLTCFSICRMIERSHLPFCPITSVGSGRDTADTYQKMLEQIQSVTVARGEAIRTLRPTLRSLFTAYEEEADAEVEAVLYDITDGKLGAAGTVHDELPVCLLRSTSCVSLTLSFAG